MPKEGLTLEQIVKNAENILGRDHYDDRAPKVLKYFAQPGVKVFRVNGKVKGETEIYDLNINFQNVSFSETKDAKHFLSVPREGKAGQIYMEQLDYKKHSVKVWCSCIWFRFACFTADTLIPLLEGISIPIEKLKGKSKFYVYSYDLDNNRQAIGEASNCKLVESKAKTIKVILDNGKEIKCTPDHKFLLSNGNYICAHKLKEGSCLQGDNKYFVVKKIEDAGYEDVYCFEVKDHHNFLIDIGNGEGVYVHNCEWYLHQHNSLFPRRKPRPYTKVAGSTRPSVNPKQLPAGCKHIWQLANYLKNTAIMKK